MTATTVPADFGATSAPARRGPIHPRTVAAVHYLLLAGAALTAVATIHTTHWSLSDLAILAGLAGMSELTSSLLPSATWSVSGSFLGITLTAVILGGAPAALVGVLTAVVAHIRWREPNWVYRNNLVTFAWFPLLAGLMFYVLHHSMHLGPNRPGYYLLVFMTFMVALALNVAGIAGYDSLISKQPITEKLRELRPILPAELLSALLMLVAVYLKTHIHGTGLAMFALILVIFQYLVGELLLSQRRADELRILATTDELTGLPNRKAFGDRLQEEIALCEKSGARFGVLLLDLDHFKDVNDTLGHQFGDDLLANIGPRLASRIGDRGVVARFGGDEFAILPARRTDDVIALGQIVHDVLACVREPVALDEIRLDVDASVGVSRYPTDGHDAQTLLRRADIAMYAAKGQGDGYRLYMADQDHHSASRLSLVSEMRHAIEHTDEIVVHFHPIVDLDTQQVHGAEALVRWQHPQQGLLQPGSFIQAVEQTGLMGPLTNVILNKAIAACAAWHADGRELTVSANLSVRNLHDPLLPTHVAQMLEQHRLPANYLKLEITESMILSDPERALATVRALSELGVGLAVDDFGTGHSSLANLRVLPVDELKIDRSFVTPMLKDKSDMVIVRSTIALGHALGLKVIAEGVEDKETLEVLALVGCDRAQGHHLSKPVPASEFVAWIPAFESQFLTGPAAGAGADAPQATIASSRPTISSA